MSTRTARGLAAGQTEEESSAICSTTRISSSATSRCWRGCACRMRSGSTISLVERQVEVLREKHDRAERRSPTSCRSPAPTMPSPTGSIASRAACCARRSRAALQNIEAGLREDFDAFHSVLLLIGPSTPANADRAVPAQLPGRRRQHPLRNAVRDRQAALRPGARLAARVPVRLGSPSIGSVALVPLGEKGSLGPARARQHRSRPLPSRHEHRVPAARWAS